MKNTAQNPKRIFYFNTTGTVAYNIICARVEPHNKLRQSSRKMSHCQTKSGENLNESMNAVSSLDQISNNS